MKVFLLRVVVIGLAAVVGSTGHAAEHVLYVPAAAHAPGLRGTVWSTDLTLFNPDAEVPRRIFLAFLPTARRGGDPAEVAIDLPASRGRTLTDVVAAVLGGTGSGALRLRSDGAFVATSRTSTPAASGGGRYGVSVPAVPGERAVAKAFLLVAGTSAGGGRRMSLGFFNPLSVPARIEYSIRSLETGAAAGGGVVELPALGHFQKDDVLAGTLDFGGAIVTYLATYGSNVCGCPAIDCCRLPAPVFGYATEVDNETGDGSFVLGEEAPTIASGRAVALGTFVMPLHACDRSASDCRDPRNHRVLLAQSDDGQKFSLVPGRRSPSMPVTGLS